MRLIPQVNSRTPCKTSWWVEKSNREYLPQSTSIYDLTYPKGYSVEENENFDFEYLISLDI